MKKRVVSLILCLAVALSLSSWVVDAETVDVPVYLQDFERMENQKGQRIREIDNTFTSIGTNAAAKVDISTPEMNQVRLSQDFSGINDLSEENKIVFRDTSESSATAALDQGVLRMNKTGTGKGTPNLEYDLKHYIRNLKNYTVEFDLKMAFAADSKTTVNVTLGADFSIRNSGDNKCTVEWHDSANWVTSDKTEYNLSEFTTIKLVVRDGSRVDFYVGDRLAVADAPQRGASYSFEKLKFTMGASMRGEVFLDNFKVSTVVPGPVLYQEDFSDGAYGNEFVFADSDPSSTTAGVVDNALVLNKTAKGAPILTLKLAGIVKNLTTYSVSFDLSAAVANSTMSFNLGGNFALRNAGDAGVLPNDPAPPQPTENQYVLEWYDSTVNPATQKENGWNTADKTLYDLNDLSNIRLVVKEQSSLDIYIGGVLVVSDVPQRSTASFKELQICLNNGLTGTVTLDHFTAAREMDVTAEDLEETLPETVNHMLRIEKTSITTNETAVPQTKMNLAGLLCGAENYTFSFEMEPELSAGSYNLYLGVYFQIEYSEGLYNLKYRPGNEDFQTIGTYPMDNGMIRFQIRVKDKTSADLYMGEGPAPVKVDAVPRSGYEFDTFGIGLNNGMIGAVYLDDLKLTLHDVGLAVPSSTTADSARIDFSDFSTGVFQDGTAGFHTTNVINTGLVSVEDAGGGYGNALCLRSPFIGCTYNVSRNYTSLIQNALTYTTEFEICMSGAQSYNIQEVSAGGGGFKLNFDLTQGKGVSYQTKNAEGWQPTSITSVAPDTWYKVKFDINTQTKKAKVYVDDKLLVEDLESYDNSPFGGLMIATNNSTQGTLRFDNFAVTVTAGPEGAAYISGTNSDGSIRVTGYAPKDSRQPKAYIAFYDGESLAGVTIFSCTPGEKLQQTVSLPPTAVTGAKLMLWEEEQTPLCSPETVTVTAQ